MAVVWGRRRFVLADRTRNPRVQIDYRRSLSRMAPIGLSAIALAKAEAPGFIPLGAGWCVLTLCVDNEVRSANNAEPRGSNRLNTLAYARSSYRSAGIDPAGSGMVCKGPSGGMCTCPYGHIAEPKGSNQLRTLAFVRSSFGAPGFEPGASWSQTKRATKLRYAPEYSMAVGSFGLASHRLLLWAARAWGQANPPHRCQGLQDGRREIIYSPDWIFFTGATFPRTCPAFCSSSRRSA